MSRTRSIPIAIHRLPLARHAILLLLALAMLLLAVPSQAQAAETVDADQKLALEKELVALINKERADRGLAKLTGTLQLKRIARAWSDEMDRTDTLAHNPRFSSQVEGDWRRLGENVGYGPSISALHTAFMNSPGHRANVLGDFNQVDVGVSKDDSKIWVTVSFLKGPVGGFPLFPDSTDTTHRSSIEATWVMQVTRGCSFGRYCPEHKVTRADMAEFVARAKELTPIKGQRFSDVPASHPQAPYINAVADAGIALGCTKDKFCPDKGLSREQMATFLARALDLEPVHKQVFSDVPVDSTHGATVAALSETGITEGCSSTRFCPGSGLSRGQIASFLKRAFGI